MLRMLQILALTLTFFSFMALAACSNDDDDAIIDVPNDDDDDDVIVPPEPDTLPVYHVALACYALSVDGSATMLKASGDQYVAEETTSGDAAHFLFRPADLGVYLLFDQEKHYLTSDGEALLRKSSLQSDTTLDGEGNVIINDTLVSEGEWLLLAMEEDPDTLLLKHRASGLYLSDTGGLADHRTAANLDLVEESDCATFPELTLNATGSVVKTSFEDGSVYGFVDAHEHMFTNYAFGGGGVFHGSPYSRLGVEHALGDCNLSHGEGGRRDIMGVGFGSMGGSIEDLIPALVMGELTEDNHTTDGYPTFTSWPNAPRSATHQMMYYKWVERAYLSGLRMFVQHATTNQVLCEMATGIGSQVNRHDCNDMVNVDRIIEETYGLERYIDALHGGPGKGWFRIVFSPEEAREEILGGKMAVILGIETSDLFSCFLTPRGDFKPCTQADVIANLDEYYEKGVRVLFPVHKFDNGFSAGDGHRGIIDLGNVMHSGHYTNFVECSEELLTFSGGFDSGRVTLAGLNQPREVYDSPPSLDMSGFAEDPVGAMLYDHPELVTAVINGGQLDGEYCQNHGMTPLGEFLMLEMMKRGMIIDVAHFPRKSYKRAYELLVEYDYPATDTHGRNMNGLLYELGGMSNTGFGRCRSSEQSATMDDGFQRRIQLIRDMGGYPAEGFGFDLNGFAGARGPRFGEHGCGNPQNDEGITYPFKSYAGDITLEQPIVGDRTVDFNNEGMVHLGMVAELIQDVRLDGTTDEELEPLFKSAEKYIRLWEKSEARAAVIRAE